MFAKKKREKCVIAKGEDRKRIWLFSTSVGAYILAYLYLFLCWQIQTTDEMAAWGFLLLTFIGAACAYGYGTLPAPKISPECLEELEKMLEDMKNEM